MNIPFFIQPTTYLGTNYLHFHYFINIPAINILVPTILPSSRTKCFLIIPKLGGTCQWGSLINVPLVVEWKIESAEARERLLQKPYQGLKKDGLRGVRVSRRNESGSGWMCEGARFEFYIIEARNQIRWCTWVQPARCLPSLGTRKGTKAIPFIESFKVEHRPSVKRAGILQRDREEQGDSTGSLPQLSLWKRKVISKTKSILFPKTYWETLRPEQNCCWNIKLLYQGKGGKRCQYHWSMWHSGVWVLLELQRKHSILLVSVVRVTHKTLKKLRAPWWHHGECWGALL